MKVLIVCGPAIGDVVFATPVIRAMKVQLDDPQVHVLMSATCTFLMQENPYVETVFGYRRSPLQAWYRLWQEKYDYVVNLSTQWSANVLCKALIGPTKFQRKSYFWKQWLMVHLKINHLQGMHEVDMMNQAVRPLGIRRDELGLDYFIPEFDKVAMHWLPDVFRRGYVVFCLSANYLTRKLPLDRMIELCDRIGKPVILLGTKEDAENGEVIASFFSGGRNVHWKAGLARLGPSTSVYNACGKFNFNQMASIIKQSWAVFTFDNDFVPVASAFRKEVFALWGNTSSLFGKYPYRTRFTTLESNNLSCRPCSASGYDKCPKGHFRCMRDIMFDFYLP